MNSMENFKGAELLELYYKRNKSAILDKYVAEKKGLENNNTLLSDVTKVEEEFNKAFEELKQRFIEQGKIYMIYKETIPENFFSVNVEEFFKEEFKEINNKREEELDKLSNKCTTIKAHLCLASTTQEAYTVLRNFKVIDKKDEIVINDFSK